MAQPPRSSCDVTRREFLQTSAGAAVVGSTLPSLLSQSAEAAIAADGRFVATFDGPDGYFHGPGWQSLNPGYWSIEGGALRRRLKNVGDRARRTGFPFHAETAGRDMETEYDPSLPEGVLYRNDWKLSGAYTVSARFTYLAGRPEPEKGDDDAWKMYQEGYGQMGVAFGGKCLFESYNKVRHALRAVWSDDGKLTLHVPGSGNRRKQVKTSQYDAPLLQPGDVANLTVTVTPQGQNARVVVEIEGPQGNNGFSVTIPKAMTEGYAGLTGRGLIDFEVNEFAIEPGENEQLHVGEIECYSCYALGDSLQKVDGRWQVRFVGLFASDGETAEVRIADTEQPPGGWEQVPAAGTAKIVNNEWRRHTSTIHATLPADPSETTLYYTVWKDGKNVTADPRIGTDACGPGTGFVGDVPSTGSYVGRLPQLTAPYKLCGLSCHAITSGLQQRQRDGWQILGGGDDWQFRDQPTVDAYKHFEDYDFQIMCWEDDVWYMELVLYPPSTDDAYKVVTTSICGPTSRWQMMRHWNVINPGDHDYGMDDVKGPEQIAIRRVDGLGQDTSYMRRNFQIVHHLITGDEEVDPLANPKKWRAWKMPQRDFTFVICDSRLWRSSQDVDMWDDSGWGAFQSLYDRTDPTRSLLGEEQFAWLQELLATDSSPLICLTGINGMHTVWNPTDQRSRVMADYAGWVKAGADRVLELLSGRDGVVTVYGDVHNGCIMKNTEQGVIECSFGPIGRSGGRSVIPGFGPQMRDFDGRELEVSALYHKTHADAALNGHDAQAPFYWNFLEMTFDPRQADPAIGLAVRNMVDPPTAASRGGGDLQTGASQTGRRPASTLPPIKTLPSADVVLSDVGGRPIRGTRSRPDGTVVLPGLVDVEPGTQVIVTAFDGKQSQSDVVVTQS